MVVKTTAASITRSNLDEPRVLMGASYRTAMTMFSDMLRRDRIRWGLRPARAAWLLDVGVPELREFDAGTRCPDFDTYERICELFGWPQAFVGESGQIEYR
jgi:hypothetical protein